MGAVGEWPPRVACVPRGRTVSRDLTLFISHLTVIVFWGVQASALLVFFVPFTWDLIALWGVSHFFRAVGLTLAFHRYFAHRAFQMHRAARFFWAFVGTAAMQKGP